MEDVHGAHEAWGTGERHIKHLRSRPMYKVRRPSEFHRHVLRAHASALFPGWHFKCRGVAKLAPAPKQLLLHGVTSEALMLVLQWPGAWWVACR